jgi:hypothetical protein
MNSDYSIINIKKGDVMNRQSNQASLARPQWYCWQFDGLDTELQVSVIRKNKPITIWCHKPENWNKDSPVLFVMHGTKRNGERYRNAWVKHSERYHFLLLVPEFSKKYYPGTRAYNLGNMISASGELLAESKWTYTAIEQVFDAVKKIMKFTTNTYSIYGHSAGAQFVHRLILFLPDARIGTAMCANAGWYTMPSYDRPFPYGLKASGITKEDLKKIFGKKLCILLGDKDINPHHRYLKQTPQTKVQGKHRYERGKRFYEIATREAEKLHVLLNWELIIVQGVGHSNPKMAKEAIGRLWG